MTPHVRTPKRNSVTSLRAGLPSCLKLGEDYTDPTTRKKSYWCLTLLKDSATITTYILEYESYPLSVPEMLYMGAQFVRIARITSPTVESYDMITQRGSGEHTLATVVG